MKYSLFILMVGIAPFAQAHASGTFTADDCAVLAKLGGAYSATSLNLQALPIPFIANDGTRGDDPSYRTRAAVEQAATTYCRPLDIVVEKNSVEQMQYNLCGAPFMTGRMDADWQNLDVSVQQFAANVKVSCSYDSETADSNGNLQPCHISLLTVFSEGTGSKLAEISQTAHGCGSPAQVFDVTVSQ